MGGSVSLIDGHIDGDFVVTNFYRLMGLRQEELAKYLVYPAGTYDCVWKATWCNKIYEDYQNAINDTVQWLNDELRV